MSEEEPPALDLVELIRRQTEAANRHDLDAFMSLRPPDGVCDASRDGAGVFEGPAAIRDDGRAAAERLAAERG